MPEFDNEMRGVLFRNSKGGNENRPDFRGNITIHGVEYQLSSWVRVSKNPEVGKYHSISVTPPEASAVTSAPKAEPVEEDVDEVGF